jgi:hypothetical protein
MPDAGDHKMKFELAFEAMRHGYCITVQENKALWYRWD